MPIIDRAGSESYYAAALDNDQLVGTISGSIIHGILVIFDFQINSHNRRKGWGGQLYDHLEAWGVANGARILVTQFSPEPGSEAASKRFYESKGITIDSDGRMHKGLS